VWVISTRPASPDAKRLILRWVDAFNARDIEAILNQMDARVDFHPLSLSGDCRTFRGHDDVREWFALLVQCDRELRLKQLEITGHTSGVTVASGVLTRPNGQEATPFCGLHEIKNVLIVSAHQYLSDPYSLLALDPPVRLGA
jgi:ketosteroid isomerase-like protein